MIRLTDMTAESQRLFWHAVPILFAYWILYVILLSLYRITFHTLAKFPGPKLAGLSYCYELWFDVALGGRYTRKIQQLHAQYGPIIRITPDELHCNYPNLINDIYASGNQKRDKSPHFVLVFLDVSMSGFGTIDHYHHRVRRTAINRFFSRSQISKLEDLIHNNAQKLCDKLLAYRNRGPFEARQALSCFTTDTITEYCFGNSTGFLDQDDWKQNYGDAIYFFFAAFNILRHIPGSRLVLDWVPLHVVSLLSAKMWSFMVFVKISTPERIRQIQSDIDAGAAEKRPTVFGELLTSNLPSREKTIRRLIDEGNALTIGGTETTAAALTLMTYHVLANSDVHRRLRAELVANIPDPSEIPSWATLETFPYLNAVIKEGLRLSHGISQRLPRIATDQDLKYEGHWTPPNTSRTVKVRHIVPRNSAIGMLAFLVHSNESIFPDALQFPPERWFNADGEKAKDLEPYPLFLSKGSRQYVGMQLAYCELFICISTMVLRVFPHLQLYQTDRSDFDYDHDELIARPRRKSKGVRLQVVDT